MAQLLDGKAVAAQIRAELVARVRAVTEKRGHPPGLGIVRVGDNPASLAYVQGKSRDAAALGIYFEERHLAENASPREVTAVVREWNADPRFDGILVQLPLPGPLDPAPILAAVDPNKDVDGLHPENAGRLALGREGLQPCTPAGIIELLHRAGIPIAGRSAVVVGRSPLVGKPAALLLLQHDATVTLCHSRTADLAAECRRAEILVVAIGRPRMIRRDWIRPGAVVIDVGINRVDGRLVGDVDFEAAERVAGWITPVPGGVGPMTRAMLMVNTVRAAEGRVWARV